jgi:hypothetical protein
MQRLGTALVHFVLRLNHLADDAIAVIVAINITRAKG